MAEHSFMATWNYCQFKRARTNIKPGELLLVNDFAQNYLCLLQNEPQGMHWEHKQVTLHPTVAYYTCPNEQCSSTVTHELVHMSEDLKHDAHIVRKFVNESIKIVKSHKIKICKIIQFSDQAPSQYKTKSAFKYLSQMDLPTMLNFFGVWHGKGPCNACAGRVKQKIDRLVKSEAAVINCATELFEACKHHLEKEDVQDGNCVHFLQTYHYTQKLSNRPNTDKWTTVPDTRKLHSLTNVPGTKIVNLRNFLCCCDGCFHGEEECTNDVYPNNWKGFNLVKKKFTNPDLTHWNVANPIPMPVSRQVNWEECICKLSNFTNFTALKNYVVHNSIPPLVCDINLNMSEQDKQLLNYVALHYLPDDAPDSFAPVSILGDGNCFPRAISYLLFRTQERHVEIRTRIVYEAVTNIESYLDHTYVATGAQNLYSRGTLPQQYAQYSDNYRPNRPLNVRQIYKSEVLDICKNGAFMGIWQVFQTSNVIKHPMHSVYPPGGNQSIRLNLNRPVWCINVNYNSRQVVPIMWTPMQVGNNRPCHFVPMLKVVR